jgi:hypothetical protein
MRGKRLPDVDENTSSCMSAGGSLCSFGGGLRVCGEDVLLSG